MIKVKAPTTFILFLSLLSQICSGQSSIGLRIFSPQFSNFTEKIGTYQSISNAKYEQSVFVGFLLGVTGRFYLKNRHYLQTELLYSMRGERYVYSDSYLNGYAISSLSGGKSSIEYYLDYRTHYIEIPLMYCIDLTHNVTNKWPVSVYLSSGLSAGINVVSKSTQNSFSIASPGALYSAIDEHTSDSQVSQINPLIVGFVTDLDVQLRWRRATKFFAYGRFNQSLTNVFNRQYKDMETKLVTYGFGLGMRWYLKPKD